MIVIVATIEDSGYSLVMNINTLKEVGNREMVLLYLMFVNVPQTAGTKREERILRQKTSASIVSFNEKQNVLQFSL